MAASPWLHAVRCSTPAATPSNSRVSRRRRPTHPARLLRLTLSHSQQWWAMAAPAPKQELLPHAVKDQLPAISYCLTSPPPWLEAILYGFQHYLVMLGTTLSNSWKQVKLQSKAQAYIGCMKVGPVLAQKKVPLLAIVAISFLIFLTTDQMAYSPKPEYRKFGEWGNRVLSISINSVLCSLQKISFLHINSASKWPNYLCWIVMGVYYTSFFHLQQLLCHSFIAPKYMDMPLQHAIMDPRRCLPYDLFTKF